MSKPCDFSLCDPPACSDAACAADMQEATGEPIALGDPRPFCGYHMSRTHASITMYTFDASGKRIGTEKLRADAGLDRGTRELWAASVLAERGFKV